MESKNQRRRSIVFVSNKTGLDKIAKYDEKTGFYNLLPNKSVEEINAVFQNLIIAIKLRVSDWVNSLESNDSWQKVLDIKDSKLKMKKIKELNNLKVEQLDKILRPIADKSFLEELSFEGAIITLIGARHSKILPKLPSVKKLILKTKGKEQVNSDALIGLNFPNVHTLVLNDRITFPIKEEDKNKSEEERAEIIQKILNKTYLDKGLICKYKDEINGIKTKNNGKLTKEREKEIEKLSSEIDLLQKQLRENYKSLSPENFIKKSDEIKKEVIKQRRRSLTVAQQRNIKGNNFWSENEEKIKKFGNSLLTKKNDLTTKKTETSNLEEQKKIEKQEELRNKRRSQTFAFSKNTGKNKSNWFSKLFKKNPFRKQNLVNI